MFLNTPPHRVAWLVTGPRRPRPVVDARNSQISPTRFREEAKKAVEKADTDLLVLGTRGFTGVAHLFLGTVAGDVLRDVACDVLVVPPRAPRK